MKKILLILLISMSSMSYGRSIEKEQLKNRNGIYYEIDQKIPYSGSVLSYYDSGEVESKIYFKDGKKEGKWIGYYKNEEISWEKNYKNGRLDGYQYTFNDEDYRSLKPDWEATYKSGYIISEKDNNHRIEYSNNGEFKEYIGLYTVDGTTTKEELVVLPKERAYLKLEKVKLKKYRKYIYGKIIIGLYGNIVEKLDRNRLIEDGMAKDKETEINKINSTKSIGSYKYRIYIGTKGIATLEKIKIGEWKKYNKRDQLLETRNYDKGIVKYYYENGEMKPENKYGLISYYKNCEIKLKKSYIDDKREELEWIGYYENGNAKYKGIYKNSEKNGEWIYYYKKGGVQRRENYKTGSLLVKVYNYKPDYDNPIDYSMLITNYGRVGAIEFEMTGKMEKPFYGEYQIYSEGNYKDGKKEGEWIFYNSTNKMAAKGNYKDGEAFGEWIKYDSNGKIEYREDYKYGEKNGEFIGYYKTGQIEYKENYKNGKENGEWISYYKNGKTKYKENYKDGEKNGETISYYETGQIEYKENYKNGKENGEFIGYYETGQIELRGKCIDGELNGEWISYDKTGQIKLKEYYKIGQIKYKENYKDGIKNGETISYSETDQTEDEIIYQ